MSEWWTYRLSSFLMFSPGTYWRTIELYNLEIWPLHLAALALGLLLLWLAGRRSGGAARLLTALLALVWLWVGWAFHGQHYAAINWGARYFALAFGLQAMLLALGSLVRNMPALATGPIAQRVGWLLAVSGIVLYPLIGWLAGRSWTQVELFGLTPEPTALATLGLLLISTQPPSIRLRHVLLIIPALSLMVGAATLWLIAGGGQTETARLLPQRAQDSHNSTLLMPATVSSSEPNRCSAAVPSASV